MSCRRHHCCCGPASSAGLWRGLGAGSAGRAVWQHLLWLLRCGAGRDPGTDHRPHRAHDSCDRSNRRTFCCAGAEGARLFSCHSCGALLTFCDWKHGSFRMTRVCCSHVCQAVPPILCASGCRVLFRSCWVSSNLDLMCGLSPGPSPAGAAGCFAVGGPLGTWECAALHLCFLSGLQLQNDLGPDLCFVSLLSERTVFPQVHERRGCNHPVHSMASSGGQRAHLLHLGEPRPTDDAASFCV